MQKYASVVQDKTGRAIKGASVLVKKSDNSSATIYSDNGGTVIPGATITTDGFGGFAFYAADGRYNLYVTVSGNPVGQLLDVLLEDPADGSPIAIVGGSVTNSAITGGTMSGTALSTITIDGVMVAGSDIAKYSRLDDADGAGLINTQQLSVGAAVRSALSEFRDAIRIKQFTGVVGDGSNDDTIGFQAALTATRSNGAPVNGGKALWVTKGTYKITAQLIIGSDQTVIFEPGVTINLVPGAAVETTSLFVASNQNNVTLIGNGAKLNGTRTGAVAEGNANGIYLYGVDNYRVQDFNISSFATDGLTITGDDTGSGPCTNGVIQNVTSDNNRRQGMSIISAKGLTVIGGMYSGTNGAPSGPFAGIDIEPNPDCYMESVVLIDVRTANNAGAGIQITPDLLATSGRRFDVSIIGGKSLNDGATSTVPGLRFVGTGATSAQQYGQVTVRDFIVDSPKGRGVGVVNWDADLSPRILLDNVGVINPDATGVAGTNYDRSGFVIYNESSSSVTNLGNVTMRDCWSTDTRGTPRMVWGAVLDTSAGKVLKNIRIDDHKSTNFTAGAKMDVATNAANVAGGMSDVSVNYRYPSSMTVAGSTSIFAYGGKRINVTTSSNALTLPAAANCAGMTYDIQCGVGTASNSVVPTAGDTIRWYADVVSTNLVLDSGGFVRLRSRGGTEWTVEQIAGQVRRAGTSQARQITYTTAIPSTGTWQTGDFAINSAPVVGGAALWECSAGGSPGTWQPVGVVGATQAATLSTTSGATLGQLETNLNLLITNLKNAKVVA